MPMLMSSDIKCLFSGCLLCLLTLASTTGCDDNGHAPWDLNGNGVCDLETEDLNRDGTCDSSDVDRDAGSDGDADTDEISCWDLNENSRCDVEWEDTDGDRACTDADCLRVSFDGAVEGVVVDATGEGVGGATVFFTPEDVSTTT